ncbi:MAG: UDP-glucose/GDP-mannose dehydrogenase family protein [Clostridia bacterium]|nr:UDP-glucose/GDP-mannose dehydrogenase family protein [Clostridia bacterium]
MNAAVIGSGYVGLVSGALLADFGNNVICVDIDEKKIENLKKGILPIYEPGLDDIIKTNCDYHRLAFTTDLKYAVENSEIIFIAVGTPSEDDGSADIQYVLSAARSIAENMNGYKIIVDKSTVPIGTGKLVRQTIQTVLDARGVDFKFDIVSNPEFLREGTAVYDFTHPDRVVLGTESEHALSRMKKLYDILYKLETPFIETTLETAEMIKYASNAFLATKITFINEIANLCEAVGANVQQVAIAMGKDGRISPKFLHAGPGYGGSCFPKDTRALAYMGREHGVEMRLVEAAIEVNERQKIHMVNKVTDKMGDLHGKTIAVWGLTFKANTDDMRESPSLVILPELVKRGAYLRVFDPQGKKEASWRLADIAESMYYAKDEYDALCGSDALMILTDWSSFKSCDFERAAKLMHSRYFFDFRNLYKRKEVEECGFTYSGVGV